MRSLQVKKFAVTNVVKHNFHLKFENNEIRRRIYVLHIRMLVLIDIT